MYEGADPAIGRVDDDEKIGERGECEKTIEGSEEEVRSPANLQQCNGTSLHTMAARVAASQEGANLRFPLFLSDERLKRRLTFRRRPRSKDTQNSSRRCLSAKEHRGESTAGCNSSDDRQVSLATPQSACPIAASLSNQCNEKQIRASERLSSP